MRTTISLKLIISIKVISVKIINNICEGKQQFVIKLLRRKVGSEDDKNAQATIRLPGGVSHFV